MFRIVSCKLVCIFLEENTTPAQENNSLSITQELLDEFKIQFEDDMPMESCHTGILTQALT